MKSFIRALLFLCVPLATLAQMPTLPATTVLGNANASNSAAQALNPLAVAVMQSASLSVVYVGTTNVTLSGTQVLDGSNTQPGIIVLLTGQATASQNGLWLTSAGAWTRPVNFPNGYIIPANCSLTVVAEVGTLYQGVVFRLETLISIGSVIIGTTSQQWLPSQTPAGAGTFGQVILGTGVVQSAITPVILASTPTPGSTSTTNADCLMTDAINEWIIADIGNAAGNQGPCMTTDGNGHPFWSAGGIAPSITGAGCSASGSATDNRGAVAATGVDTCTITFGANFTVIPFCVVSGYSAAALPFISTPPTISAVVVKTAAAGTFSYACL